MCSGPIPSRSHYTDSLLTPKKVLQLAKGSANSSGGRDDDPPA